MSILKKIGKGLTAFVNEVNKPESFSKGEEFESYIRKNAFPLEKYQLVHQSHKYNENKEDYVETSLKPDFQFRCLETGKEFFVEVKFRKGVYYQNKIEWCKPFQLKRYKEIDNTTTPIFIALGLGDNPNKPEEIFIIPLSKVNYNALYDSFLDKYSFYIGKPVFSSYLWKLLA